MQCCERLGNQGHESHLIRPKWCDPSLLIVGKGSVQVIASIHTMQNALVEALVILSQRFVFGQVKGGDERTAASADGGTASNGDWRGDDGGNGNSARVEASQMTEHSQHMRQGQNLQDKY